MWQNKRKLDNISYDNRKILPPVLSLITHSTDISTRRSSMRINSVQSANAIANAFAHKALIIRDIKNEHAEEVFERSKKLLETCNIPVINCRYFEFQN